MVKFLAGRTREERIRELKAMRAELMAIKEQLESEDGDSEAANASLASIRKNYSSDLDEAMSQGTTLDDAKREIYSQYEGEEPSRDEDQGKQLTRGLRR